MTRVVSWLRARRVPLVVALLALVTFGIYAATTDRDRVVNDVSSAGVAAWQIAGTGAPWLEGVDLDAMPHVEADRLWLGETTHGHTTIFRSPGAVAAGVPAYAVANLGTDPANFSIVPAAIWASLLAVVSLLLLAGALHGLRRPAWVVAALGALAFGTPMWSINADGLWTHALTVLGIAGMAWAARHDRWWLVGLFGGIGLWGRLHVALIVAILGLGLAVWRRRPSIALQVGVVSAALMGLAAAWSRWVYGVWAPQGSYPSGGAYLERTTSQDWTDHLVNHAGLWLSLDRGLLVWTPVLVLLVPAVVRSWRSVPDWARVLAVGGLAYSLVQGQLNGFTGGMNFYGYRLTLETLVCLFPLVALSAGRTGAVGRRLLGPFLALQTVTIAIGAVTNGYLLPVDAAWRDHALALALRTDPELSVFLVIALVMGILATSAWRGRGLHHERAPAPGAPDHPDDEPGPARRHRPVGAAT